MSEDQWVERLAYEFGGMVLDAGSNPLRPLEQRAAWYDSIMKRVRDRLRVAYRHAQPVVAEVAEKLPAPNVNGAAKHLNGRTA